MQEMWILVGAIIICTVIIVAHNEWRYRRLVTWIDAIGEMVSDFIKTQRNKQ